MKILLAHPDQRFKFELSAQLKKHGILCEQADNFKDTFKKIINHEYECILLFQNISELGSVDLVKVIQKENPATGLIVFSEENILSLKLNALQNGADDYLIYPFETLELIARIKSILRRKNGHSELPIAAGKLSIRPNLRQVQTGQDLIALTKKEFDILLFLIRNKNRVVTKDSIAGQLWGDYMDEADSYDFIYAHLKNLRKKLDNHQCGHYIKTVYGLGYKFSLN
jgi:DNA-binding response OmpR family regulator